LLVPYPLQNNLRHLDPKLVDRAPAETVERRDGVSTLKEAVGAVDHVVVDSNPLERPSPGQGADPAEAAHL
jgi:hypothetical protein